MEENKKVDVLSKKRPTVNELKTEVIRLRKDLDKSNADLNHYKYTYEKVSSEQKNLIDKCSKLVTSNNFLEAVIASIIALGAIITMILRLV